MFETQTKLDEAKRMGSDIAEAVRDSKCNMERMAKRARYAAADYKSEAAHHIKKNPLETVAMAFVAGAGIAFIAGYFAGRPHNA